MVCCLKAPMLTNHQWGHVAFTRGAISREMLRTPILDMNSKTTHLIQQPYISAFNELIANIWEKWTKQCLWACRPQNTSIWVYHVWLIEAEWCIGKLCHHLCRLWLVACTATTHYLNQWWFIVNYKFSFKKMPLNLSSAKWHPSCRRLGVIRAVLFAARCHD